MNDPSDIGAGATKDDDFSGNQKLLLKVAAQRRELTWLRKKITDVQSLLLSEEDGPNESVPEGLSDKDLVRHIETIIKTRTLRSTYMPKVEFGEAAWDMLLDLAVARFWSRETSVSSLCIAGRVPTTTALRIVKILIEDGVIKRYPDPVDGRRTFVRISDAAYRDLLDLMAASKRDERRLDASYRA